MTESVFFQDLAVVMSIAGLAAVVFSRLGWPKVFGYILVGILMNGHTWGGAFLADPTSIGTISQLGIVFLMLTMGLEFSTSDMKRIKGVTLPTALIDTVLMVWLGYMVGTRVLGWQTVPSLFLGAAICDSATTLLAKMIGDLGWSRRPFVKYVIGTSVCEDIVCVGVLALITGVANGSGMSLAAVGMSMGGLFLFFLCTVVFGLVLVPRLLKSVARRDDDEALLLAQVGLCFFISWVAYKLDYSLALGAFLVGIVGASSEVKHRILRLVAPMRSLFASMFFVSIGLLVDPGACWEHAGTILLLVVTVVAGKTFNCFLGGVLTGQDLKAAVQMALSLAQIGEFAFMVALVYVGLSGDLTSAMFQVTIGVSLVTTLLNPLLIRLSDPVGSWVERKCPVRIARVLETYRAFLAKYRSAAASGGSRRKVRAAVVELGIVAVLEFAVSLVLRALAHEDWSRFSTTFERYDQYIFLLLANLFMLALFAPVVRIARLLSAALNDVLVGTGEARWKGAVRHIVDFVVPVAVLVAFGVEFLLINLSAEVPHPGMRWALMGLLVGVGAVGWRFFVKAGLRARARFEEALAVDARLADLGTMITIQVPEDSFTKLAVPAGSAAVGGTVVTLDIRAKTGASIVSVERNGRVTRNVGPQWVFAAGDVLTAIGDTDQVARLQELLGMP